jgi:LysR family hydrogen peroxide-inducible transcriptional activator
MLLRFAQPEPLRTIGLVWRSTSPRKQDFQELGRLIARAASEGPLTHARNRLKTAKT